jgi:hypothetical protein
MRVPKKVLDKTDGIRTIEAGRGKVVDASIKKLLRELKDAENAKWRASRRIGSIHAALEILGVKPQAYGAGLLGDTNEMNYVSKEPFRDMGLAETCERRLKDYEGKWITRAHVEYLATRGGYDFSTKDSQNSVDVTLRRLAGAGKCDAERVRGSRGNKYRWVDDRAQSKLQKTMAELEDLVK